MHEAASSESFLPDKKVLPDSGSELLVPGVELGADSEGKSGPEVEDKSGVETGDKSGVESGSDIGTQLNVEETQRHWLTEAVVAAYETVRNHPVEITGGALAALLAIRFRGVIGEGAASLADDAARLLGGIKPFPQITGPTNVVTESGAAITAAARDGISLPAPWVMRNGVKETADLTDLLRTGHFDSLIPKQLPPGTIAIPSVTKEFLKRTIEYPAPSLRIEPEFGKVGFLYQTWKDSTVKILGTKEGGGGTGFFLRDNGIGATANHVVERFLDGNFRVLMANGEVLPARLLAREASKDVALFRVDGLPYVRPFEFAPIRSLRPGTQAHMIGHPGGVPEKVMNSGRLEGFNQVVKDGDTPYLGIRHSIESFSGFSGSPVIIDSGKVAGAHVLGRHAGALGEAVSIRHYRKMLDDATRRTMVQGNSGIDEYRTSVLLTQNARGVHKTEILGRKLFTS